MLQLSRVTTGYPSQTRVLDQVSVDIKRGEFVYVLGGTGAGKSTLLRVLATEEPALEGDVRVLGYALASAPRSTLQRIRRLIGYVPQNVRLIDDLSVYDNVMLSLNLAQPNLSTHEAKNRTLEALDRLGIMSLKSKLADALSGGEAQRVAVARALVRKPELIIADEPTGAQDRDHTWSVMDALLRANLAGSTVVLATHDREIIKRVRKRCLTLASGRLHNEELSTCSLSP